MTSRWIANKRFDVANIASYAILWCLWKIRNNLCFSGRMLDKGEDGVRRTCKDVEKMDTVVQARGGGTSDVLSAKAGNPGSSTAANLLGGYEDNSQRIWVGDVGLSSFGSGLHRCDSI